MTTTAVSANRAAAGATRSVTTEADPAATAAGRTTASATATPTATATATVTMTPSAPSRAYVRTRSMIPAAATRTVTAERTPGKGNHHQSLQRKEPSHLPRASAVLSVASPSRHSGGRGPQPRGISRYRQRPLGPTVSSTVGCHLLARCTLQPRAAARKTSPRAAHLGKENFLRPLSSTCQPGTI